MPGVPKSPNPDRPQPDEYMRRVLAHGLAIADRRIPDGVDPESSEGRHYARLIEHVRADVARAPELTPTDLAPVVVLLRGPNRAA